MTLVISTDTGKQVGRIILAGGALKGSSKGTQRFADYALRKAGGDARRAYQALSTFSNGYLDVSEEPDADLANVELGWRYNPLEHRNAHGEWSRDGSEAMKALSGMKWGDGKVYKAPPADRTMAGGKKASDNLFIRKYGLSAGNIVAAYDDANAAELDEGMRWYSDAHTVARMIGGGDADKGAALLSAFSPQTDWQTNAINAAHTIELGHPPEHGTGITGTVQDKARAILARDHGPYDDLFPASAQKTNAFYKLIRNGGDAPDDEDGLVVMDRHALSVAAGRRLTKDQTDTPSYADVRAGHPDWDEDQVKAYRSTLPPAPVGSVFTYQHMADMYREAALTVSKRDGTQVSPHQMQAVTWLRQQRKNNELDAALVAQGEAVVKAGGKMGTVPHAAESKGRFARAAKAWAAWEGYAAGHTIATHLGTTAIGHENPISVSNDASTISGQLDLAGGWHDAWKHELRGRHGEWGAGTAPAGAVGDRKQLGDAIMAALTKTRDKRVKSSLFAATRAWDAGDMGGAAGKVAEAAGSADNFDEAEKLDGLRRDLAKFARDQASPPAPTLPKPDDAELSRVSDSLTWLHDDAAAHDRPAEAAHLKDAASAIAMLIGAGSTGSDIRNIAADHLIRAAAIAEYDPDGGHSRAEQYRALADRAIPGSALSPSPEIAAVKDFLDKNAAAVPALFGKNLTLAWDGQVPTEYRQATKPSYLAQIDWQGHMSISDGAAENLRHNAALSTDGGLIEDPDAFTVPLHEMVHAVMPANDFKPGEYRAADSAAYQERAVQAIEEGFTQLGTAQHAEEFFRQAGLADKRTPFTSVSADGSPAPNPVLKDKEQAIRKAISAVQRKLGDPDLPHGQQQALQIATALSRMRTDLFENMDPHEARQELNGLLHAGWPEVADDGANLKAMIKDYLGTAQSLHDTMAQFAQRMAEPVRIKGGTSWPHYADWTADAQRFGETIAELGGHPGDQREVRRVSDAVNSVGTARKTRVMAELTLVASGQDKNLTPTQREVVLASMKASISNDWQSDGPEKAVKHSTATAKQKIQQMRMMAETAAA